MGFRRIGTHGLVALVLVFAGMVLFADPVWAAPVLSVNKSDNADPAAVGENFAYTITVKNTGDQPATEVALTDNLPAALDFVSVVTSKGTCPTTPDVGESGVVICDLNNLGVNDTATVTITVNPTGEGEIDNTASAVTITGTRAFGEDTEETRVTSGSNADSDLTITKDDDPDPVEVGEELTYTLTVENDTGRAVNNVEIEDTLPADVEFVDADPECDEPDGRIITCDLGTIRDNSSETVEIIVEPTEVGTITNRATLFVGNEEIEEVTARTRVEDDGNNNRRERREREERFRERVNEVLEEEGLIDEDGDGDIDQDDEFLDAQNDLNGEGTDGEITDGEITDANTLDDDGDLDDSPVSATAEDGQAEASTPGAVARSGGDPDELEPLRSAPDDVVNEIPTSGPLPNTGGMPAIYWLLPLAGLLILAGLPVYRWIKSRG